jgi:hypothetical protein
LKYKLEIRDMYDPYTNDWKREVGMATAGVLRALTVAMPMLAGFAAAGILIHLALSGPFDFSCKSTLKPKRRTESVRVLPDSKTLAHYLRETSIAEDK